MVLNGAVHVLQVCRDPSLIEFFLEESDFPFDDDAWTLIFYTGRKRKLQLKRERLWSVPWRVQSGLYSA